MTFDELGALTRAPDGTYTVRFERELRHPLERVWAALTDPDEARHWFTEMTMQPRVGGQLHFDFGDQGEARGKVTVWEPPSLVEHSWIEAGFTSNVRWELLPQADGTRVILTHTGLAAVAPHEYAPAGTISSIGYPDISLASHRRTTSSRNCWTDTRRQHLRSKLPRNAKRRGGDCVRVHSPAGAGYDDVWRRVLSGVTTASIDDLFVHARCRVTISCRVPVLDPRGVLEIGSERCLDRFAQLALIATREAVAASELSADGFLAISAARTRRSSSGMPEPAGASGRFGQHPWHVSRHER